MQLLIVGQMCLIKFYKYNCLVIVSYSKICFN